MIFFDRYDAGKQLTKKLQNFAYSDSVIFAIPKGGIIVANEVAKRLHIPIELILVKKISDPSQKEFGIAAISDSGYEVVGEKEKELVLTNWYANEVVKQREKMEHIRDIFNGIRIPRSATGKTAILIDDGIATGLTMKAAIYEINRQHPSRVIIATPIISFQVISELKQEVDQVISLITPTHLFSLSDYYENFSEISDEEIRSVGKSQIPAFFYHHLHRIF